ncbi:MAG: tetratricopeptide repeat protein [Rhodanobacteraceae bacterium]
MTSDPSFTFESINSELEIARTHVRQGNLAEAERVYRHVAAGQPDQVEALRFLANAALSRGDPGEAVTLLSRAAQVDRSNIGVLLELGVAYRSAQRMDEARSVFERALESSQGRNTTARLLLANVLEQDNRPEMALLHYFRAILDAQSSGQWRDESTTEPGLRQLVQHAMRYVDTSRHDRFGAALEPFKHGINAARLGRIDAALASYLHERAEPPADARQQPTFLHIPDPEATCFLDTAAFDWLPDWSARASALDGEALACISNAMEEAAPTPFSLESMTVPQDSITVPARERRIPLCQRGIYDETIRNLAPGLSRLLDVAPLARIPNYAPNATILALHSGARTQPYRGRTNAFCAIAVGFANSATLQITVGGEPRRLQVGEPLVFDSSFGVEYAATSDEQAYALVLETWNPRISPLETDALTALITSVLDFDSHLQDLA